MPASCEGGCAFANAAANSGIADAYALDVVSAPIGPSHTTASPPCPASPIADRAFSEIVTTRPCVDLRMTSASVGVSMRLALSPPAAGAPRLMFFADGSSVHAIECPSARSYH